MTVSVLSCKLFPVRTYGEPVHRYFCVSSLGLVAVSFATAAEQGMAYVGWLIKSSSETAEV